MEVQLRPSSRDRDAIAVRKAGQKRSKSNEDNEDINNLCFSAKICKKKRINSNKPFNSKKLGESGNKKEKKASYVKCSDVEVNEVLPQTDETINKRLKISKSNEKRDIINDCVDQVTEKEETSESKVSQRNEKAFAYLDLWKFNKSQWKFQKITQSWLIANIFDIEKVPEKHFKIFLEYAIGMQGRAKEIVNEKSHELIRKYEIIMKEKATESEDCKTEEQRYFRARSLLQHLN